MDPAGESCKSGSEKNFLHERGKGRLRVGRVCHPDGEIDERLQQLAAQDVSAGPESADNFDTQRLRVWLSWTERSRENNHH